MKILSLDGIERPVARIRELLTADFVHLLREDYVAENEATDDTLRKALESYVKEDNDESMDPGQFVRGVTNVGL